MATKTHTVGRGDTLSGIAAMYKSEYGYTDTYEYMNALVKHNNISNPDIIIDGQVIRLDVNDSSTAEKPEKNNTSKPVIKLFGLQSNTDRTIYATWTWDKDNTENYKLRWYYATGDGVWFIGDDGTSKYKQSTYNAPSNATKVKFKVKAVSKTHVVNDKETTYWTSDWSTVVIYNFSPNPPSKPPAPTVEMDNLKLTASLANLDINADEIEFQIVKNDKSTFKKAVVSIRTTAASYSCSIIVGSTYKVRARGIKQDLYGEWSDYSENVGTPPAASKGWINVAAKSETEVQLDWANVSNATSYEIQYTTKKRYFDSSSEVQSHTVESVVGHAEITGLETGQEWFFRVRAINDNGESAWTEITSIVLGKKPTVPTTWSSTVTVMVGEALKLYWIHNSIDGSSQTYAELELTIDGEKTVKTIKNSTSEAKKDKTSSYTINTSSYKEGTVIKWRVRTRGITNEYSDWSTKRTVKVYAEPVVELTIRNQNGKEIDVIKSFPFLIVAFSGPDTQKTLGYHVEIIANKSYEQIDNVGNTQIVSAGEAVYSENFDENDNALALLITADAVNLQNNVNYKIVVTASMNSGLIAKTSVKIPVAWRDEKYEPNAEISYDAQNVATTIRAYCKDENKKLIKGITLSVYRREYDGSFTMLATGLNNAKRTYITDPHPSLDYARYRIVAISDDTGAVSYYDVPGYFIGETSAVIQWDEEWSNFDIEDEFESKFNDMLENLTWSGSLIKLPYNVDISEDGSPDVELIEYIGREQPVSYYGTQLGETATWRVEIEHDDKETLYALRRLKRYMGDVYVREPSGSGYWANVNVSISQTHCELTIPVTLKITRVAGGM